MRRLRNLISWDGRRMLSLVTLFLTGIFSLTACGTPIDTSINFERDDNVFADGEQRLFEECNRNALLSDNIDRPIPRNKRPVQPLRLQGDKLVGETDNLPPHFYDEFITHCWSSIGTPAVAVADLNGDGFDDIVKPRDQVWMNDGRGGFDLERLPGADLFGERTGADGLKVPLYTRWTGAPAVADLDRDGDMEIITAVNGGATSYLFYVYTRQGAAWVDVTADFAPKLNSQILGSANSITVLDYDNDGLVDIIVSFADAYLLRSYNEHLGFANSGIVVFRNTGAGFEDVSRQLGIPEAVGTLVDDVWNGSVSRFRTPHVFTHAIGVGDLDADGFVDLVVAGDFGTGLVLWNEAGKRLVADETIPVTGFADMGPALTDVNGDGYLDIFISQIHSKTALYVNCYGGRPCPDAGERGNLWLVSKGPRSYVERAAESGLLDGNWGWGATFADFDNDGRDELVQAAGFSATLSPKDESWSFRSDPTLLFTRPASGRSDEGLPGGRWREVGRTVGIDIAGHTGGVAVGDFDRDGRIDLVVASALHAKPILYRNQSRSVGSWLEITPTDSTGRHEAWGARVIVSTSDRVSTGTAGMQSQSYMSNGSTKLWFGLGSAQTADVEIVYPDGSVRRWSGLAVNQSLRLAAE